MNPRGREAPGGARQAGKGGSSSSSAKQGTPARSGSRGKAQAGAERKGPVTAAAKGQSKKSRAKGASKKTNAAQGGQVRKSPRKGAGGRPGKSTTAQRIGLAFFAGLILAAVLFWNLRDLSFPDLASVSSIFKSAPAPGQRGPAKGTKAEKASAAEAGRPEKSGQSPSGRPAADSEERRKSAIESALHDLQALAYEESLLASLDERIRQVDYAIVQSSWMRALPASQLRLMEIEERKAEQEPYHFQRISILVTTGEDALYKALTACLDVWAPGATLVRVRDSVWSVRIDAVETHRISLYRDRGLFLDQPEGKSPVGSLAGFSATPLPGMERPRIRGKDEAPKLVIVIDDLGANKKAIQDLLALDYPVSFAFWPHGAHTRYGAKAAHARGREIIVHQPMEPEGYPSVKPGPNVLLVSMSQARISSILDASIAAVPHASGLNNHMGSRFTQHAPGVNAVIAKLKRRGMFMLDSVTHPRSLFAAQGKRLGIERYHRNVFLDVVPEKTKVLQELRRAERIALLTGQAVAIGHPLPATLEALKEWQRVRNSEVQIVRLRDLRQD
ncbi:divergent polysaccharide deacetylase family protein [Desulfovibrio sp. OttesenSCG-928-A18]|nr:divergent polysaccharide deacetylase family protein [Desulfovibrio sp. OttesenSCG-928-A18]